MRRFAFLATTLLSAQLLASGNYGVTLDYLYWKPANFSYDFSDAFTETSDGRTLNTPIIVDAPYNSGVRGEAWWNPCCNAFSLIGRYYWTESRHSQSFTTTQPFTFPFDAGIITPRIETLYHAADILLSYELLCHPRFELGLLAGGEVLYAALNQELTTTGNNVTLWQFHNRMAGGGVSVGLTSSWHLFRCLDLFAEARYGMLFGSSRGAFVGINFGQKLVGTPFSAPVWTREVDLRLGGRFSGGWGCTRVGLELGWEQRQYNDFPSWEISFYTNTSLTTPNGLGLGKAMGGPFVGLFVSF